MKKSIFIFTISLLAMASNAIAQSLQDAQRYMRNEQFEDAEKTLKELIAKKATNHDAYYLLGLNYMNRAEYGQALTAFNDGLTNAPKCLINKVGTGAIKLINGNESSAIEDFTAAVNGSKKKLLPQINREIGRAYITKGQLDAANKAGWSKYALRYLNESNSMSPGNYETEMLIGDAYMLTIESDASKPVEQYMNANQNNPKDPVSLVKLADLWRRAGNPNAAKDELDKAIALDANYAPIYRVMGSVLSDMGKNEEALKSFEKYLSLNPNLSARRQYVSSLYLNKKYEECIKEGKDVLANKEFTNLYGVIALAHAAAQKETDLEFNQEGLKYFELYEKKDLAPKNKTLNQFELFQKAYLLQNTGQFDAAEGLYLESIKDTANSNVEVINQVANVMLSNQSYENYLNVLATKLNKTKTPTLTDLINSGMAYSNLGKYDQAISSYNAILKMDSTNNGAYSLVARTQLLKDTNDVSGLAQANYYKWIQSLSPQDKVSKLDQVKYAYQVLAGAAQRRKDWADMLKQYKNLLALDPTDEQVASVVQNLEKYLSRAR